MAKVAKQGEMAKGIVRNLLAPEDRALHDKMVEFSDLENWAKKFRPHLGLASGAPAIGAQLYVSHALAPATYTSAAQIVANAKP